MFNKLIFDDSIMNLSTILNNYSKINDDENFLIKNILTSMNLVSKL